jgi:hypothetical protein
MMTAAEAAALARWWLPIVRVTVAAAWERLEHADLRR